jgi:hypothetical protein
MRRVGVLRRLALAIGLIAVLASQIQAPAPAFAGGGGDKEADACAAERAPILERQKQYEAVKRSRLSKALGAGLQKGAMFFAGQMMNRYVPGLGGGSGGGASVGGISIGGAGIGLLSPANLGEAGKLAIPGVTAPAGGEGLGSGALGTNDTRAIAAMAVVVAIVGTVEAYVQLKEQEANGDSILLANSIDDDAQRQVDVNKAIAAEEAALSACRARQVADYKARLSGASNSEDRHGLARDKSALQTAIKKDVDLTGGVVDQQAGLAKTYTQGRAMSEGKSEADVLGGQAPAYAPSASTAALKLPPAADGKTMKPAGPPPPPTWVTTKAVTLRTAPRLKAPALESLAAGAQVEVQDDPKAPAGWSVVKFGGKTGYVHTADLVKTVPTGPVLAPPSNIREHNRAVLVARDQGPDRLKTLLTDVQTS